MTDRSSCILIYTNVTDEPLPSLAGVWRGSYPAHDAEESIGLLIRQGLAGFNEHATWRNLADQLESSGFRCENISVDEVMRIEQDVVRIIFLADGQINCQWLTRGPDDNARAADKPIAVLPSREDN